MSERKLSIVMPALLHRAERSTMLKQINDQIADRGTEVEFFCLLDNGPMSTGAKIQSMFDLCSGRYICLVADDDKIEHDYIETILSVIDAHNVDAITFDHTYQVDGSLLAITKQIPGCSERHTKPADSDIEIHERLPGPLCPVKAGLAKEFRHPDASEKEDHAYKLFLRDRIKTHCNIDRILYHHIWSSDNKRERGRLQQIWKRS